MVLCRPILMGVLNVTPDSFSDGGLHSTLDEATSFAKQMVAQGADIIDVGGESTRPGSLEVAIEEEIARTQGVVEALAKEGICVSIDTRHAAVAKAAIEAGASIINDVTGFSNPEMLAVAASCNAGVIAMHMRQTPETMQDYTHYDDVVEEVASYLADSAKRLETAGVDPRRICIDPGPGFAKNSMHNMLLLSNMDRFASLGYPLMSAFSRKSTLGQITGVDDASKRVASSASAAVLSYIGGARIFRVHDVAETRQALQVLTNADSAALLDAGEFAAKLPDNRAFVSFGSNMGDSVANICDALVELDSTPGIDVIASSSIYETEPAYYIEQGRFANSVAWVQTTLSPYELLDRLFEIENDFKRVRVFANGPRTLDLDLLDYEGVISDDPHLILPHPRILERAFTVEPLLELEAKMGELLGDYLCADALADSDDARSAYGMQLSDGSRIVRDGVKYGAIVAKLLDSSEVM